ncbi:hypothetical protein GL2_41830 [Microbulbifer sp. GL-2]|nr:hypothetical protein GL2_41830 [Microbulbifer sp. GL-2]
MLATNRLGSEVDTDELTEGAADVDNSGSPSESQSLESTEGKRAVSEEPQDVKASTPEMKRKPIDISVVFEEDMDSGEAYDFSRKSRLPDLFNQQAKEDGITFSGKLISDPENPDYFDSVEGAEFSVEVKTR